LGYQPARRICRFDHRFSGLRWLPGSIGDTKTLHHCRSGGRAPWHRISFGSTAPFSESLKNMGYLTYKISKWCVFWHSSCPVDDMIAEKISSSTQVPFLRRTFLQHICVFCDFVDWYPKWMFDSKSLICWLQYIPPGN
jgi:hypothetical protein